MPTTYTVTEAAKQIGCKPVTVRRWAVELSLGRLITPRMRLLSTRDIATIKARVQPGPGQPRKPKDNS